MIGEPRLDSGLILEAEHRPAFDPLMPLLPQELCWILDRSFSYEVKNCDMFSFRLLIRAD